MTTSFNRRNILTFSGSGLALGWLGTVPAYGADAPSKPTMPMPPLEVFAQPPLVDNIALSPNGKRVAMVSQNGDFKMLLHTDIAKVSPANLPLGKAKIRNLMWGDNEHVVVVNSETAEIQGFRSKGEFSTASSINLTTGTAKTLFLKQENYYPVIMGGLRRIKTPDGYRISANNFHLIDDMGLTLFKFGLDSSRGEIIYEATTETKEFVVTPEGHPLAFSEYKDDLDLWKLYYNFAPLGSPPKFKSIYEVKEALNYPSLDGLGRDGKTVVVFINHGAAKGEYHEINSDGILGPPLDDRDNSAKKSSLYHPVTWRFNGFLSSDDWTKYEYSDPLLEKLTAAMPQMIGEDYRWLIADFAEDPRKMIVYGESEKDAGSYFFVDFTTGDVQHLASNYSALPAEWTTQKKPVSYKAADGLEISAYLTLPPFKIHKDLPLVVLPHGGPQSRDNLAFDWQAQALAARGYAVLQPNFRGSAGYGQKFVDAGHGEFGRKMQTDLSDGVRELVKQGIVDPKRVAIMGASYGGYAALAGATLDPGIYTCAIAIAGVTDPKSFIEYIAIKTGSKQSSSVTYWKQFMGDETRYDEISPVKQAAKASCPILLIHGTDDTVVPIEQSRRMESALKAAGKPVEFVTYKGQDHWETVGSARIEMMTAAMAFLGKYNPT